MEFPEVELLCLGNELLIGRTVNTNATYIGLKMTKLGYKMKRITTVGDYFEDIHEALNEITKRQPKILIIMGGLGPTHDDIQLEAIAKFLKRPLELNEKALEFIKRRIGNVSESRMKMAMLPSESVPLQNEEGVAPGVMTHVGDMIWFSLPGVPREMKSILDNEIIPRLVEKFGRATFHEYGFNAYNIGESKITGITRKLVKKYPECYFKSHPKKKGNKYWLSLHVYSVTLPNEKVREVAEEWREAILQNDGVEATIPEPVFTDDFNPEMTILDE